jgi:uncharacterized protein YrzB (UPF0473 family)
MPLPKKLSKTIKKFAKKDGKISKKLYPYVDKVGDLKLYVLRQNGRERKFDILAIIDKWGVDFDKFRDRHLFSVSTVLETFGEDGNETFFDILRRSTHVAKNNELYSIKEGDTVQAFQFEWAYKIYGEIQGKGFDLTDTEA